MSFVRDIAVIGGAAMTFYGLWQWSSPLAYVAGGMLIITGACAWSWASRKEPQ